MSCLGTLTGKVLGCEQVNQTVRGNKKIDFPGLRFGEVDGHLLVGEPWLYLDFLQSSVSFEYLSVYPK